MPKVKFPFLSLGARGSVGGSITVQDGIAGLISRTKPFPTDPHSLPQAYRRWLYQDYAYLWSQQSDAIKAQYRSAGSRHHLTAFQYWIKVMLTTQPDILGIWHLDDKAGSLARDSSLNPHHGTLYGPTLAPGLIDYARYFTTNDYIHFGTSSWVRPDAFSLDFFAKWTSGVTVGVATFSNTGGSPHLALTWTAGKSIILLGGSNYRYFDHSPVDVDDGNWHHIVFIVTGNGQDDIDNSKMYVDGQSQTIFNTTKTGLPLAKTAFGIGIGGGTYFYGYIDHIFLYNRSLDATEAQLHSIRRYPYK